MRRRGCWGELWWVWEDGRSVGAEARMEEGCSLQKTSRCRSCRLLSGRVRSGGDGSPDTCEGDTREHAHYTCQVAMASHGRPDWAGAHRDSRLNRVLVQRLASVLWSATIEREYLLNPQNFVANCKL